MNLSASHRTPGEMLKLLPGKDDTTNDDATVEHDDDDDDIGFDDEDDDGIYHNDDGRGPVELKPERAMTILLQLCCWAADPSHTLLSLNAMEPHLHLHQLSDSA